MNKYDILNNILNNLNRLNVTGVDNMHLILDSVQSLQVVAQMLAKEDEAHKESEKTDEAAPEADVAE